MKITDLSLLIRVLRSSSIYVFKDQSDDYYTPTSTVTGRNVNRNVSVSKEKNNDNVIQLVNSITYILTDLFALKNAEIRIC